MLLKGWNKFLCNIRVSKLFVCRQVLMLQVDPPKLDRSKDMRQTKNDTLVLQVGGWAWV
jgi:hypothetical protein